MRNEHTVKQMVNNSKKHEREKGNTKGIQWWQLSLIGIGSIIGAGFLLGTGLSIKTAGTSMIFAYLLGGIIAFLAFSALAEMSVHDPQPGSFRTYARLAFGERIGFVSGWMYWISGVLIMSSEVTALSIFTQYWFHHVPLWIFAIIYSVLGLGINLLGMRNFGKIETLFAVVKISTLVIFILFGLLLLFGVISAGTTRIHPGTVFHMTSLFPHGFTGWWSSLIFALFSFGGIAVIGVTSNELKHKKDVSKSGIVLIITLLCLYVLSLFMVVSMVSWTKIDEGESPFVTALSNFPIPYLGTIFNIIIISAAFSTMVGSLFSITKVMVSLSNDGEAPKTFSKTTKKGVPLHALLLGFLGLAAAIIVSLFLPSTVYEYLTTAAGVTLILNWCIILASQIKYRKTYLDQSKVSFKMSGSPFTSYSGIVLIVFVLCGGLFRPNERYGLFISLGIILIIFLAYSFFGGKRKGN
ncbi:amino acid permease [Bacillus sp. ISL-18]|uniref:amino acid permease n=1 Tax=Bacillus sp. ISL-18 TaxID=2819118 RepID=UPI001BE9064C|nr:amino acid permease [Bacillus sp. ISL-18]MBT2655526.1 amino acid permease [Bacillus sp. ISL-18]